MQVLHWKNNNFTWRSIRPMGERKKMGARPRSFSAFRGWCRP